MSHRESLSRSQHDRNYLRRSDPGTWWNDGGTRAIVTHKGHTLVSHGALVTLTRDEIPPGQLEIFLGTVADGHRVGVVLDDDARAGLDARLGHPADGHGPLGVESTTPVWRGLRDIGTALDDADTGLVTELVALAHWHESHAYSPATGRRTEVAESGWVRRDPETGAEHFPRTDPAIIVAVIHRGDDGEERLLLARNSAWEEGRYSILAGFVEPGESLEAAVVREVAEEVGILVDDPAYFGSQPWPFPASLMLGFFADARSADIRVDGQEIVDATWFTRDELTAAIDGGVVRTPGTISIAGHLIRAWREGTRQ